MPGIVVACLCCLLQEDGVAHGVHPSQAQTTGKGFILRQRDVFGRHLVREPLTLVAAVRDDRLLHATVDPLLGPIRSPHETD